ncbi:MAG: hypothetical protein ACYSUR_16275 [Planctomycetota bacterium]|jgi:hypothetical protein
MYWTVKGHLVKITALLAIGAVVNVATAWACALALDIGEASVSELYTPLGPEHHWEVFRWDAAPGTRVVARCWRGMGPSPYNPGAPELLLPRWTSIDPPDRDTPEAVSHVGEAWGYPMRSMSCGSVSRPAADGSLITATRGIARLQSSDRRGGAGLYLPTKPIWTGFSVNTVLYALVGLAVYGALRDSSRLLRRRRTPAAVRP